jgi:hypothetical protein
LLQAFFELVRLVRRFQSLERPNSASGDANDFGKRRKKSKCAIL